MSDFLRKRVIFDTEKPHRYTKCKKRRSPAVHTEHIGHPVWERVSVSSVAGTTVRLSSIVNLLPELI